MKKTIIYLAGAITLLWGIAHLIPTKGVVADFGDITVDNQLIITMEWMVEGFSLIFLGILVFVVAITDPGSRLARNVLISVIGMLLALTVLSLFTGFWVDFIPFKLCPFIFTASAAMLFIGIGKKAKGPINTTR